MQVGMFSVQLVRRQGHSGPYGWLAWSVGGLSGPCAGLLDRPRRAVAPSHTPPFGIARARRRATRTVCNTSKWHPLGQHYGVRKDLFPDGWCEKDFATAMAWTSDSLPSTP